MAMKETEGSLRAYLVLAGALSVLAALMGYSNLAKLEISALSLGQKTALYVPILTNMVLGCGFIAAGFLLKKALVTGATWIKKLLIASGAMLFINGALVTAEFDKGIRRSGIIGALVGVAITIYLYRSVVRLADEAAAKAGIAPPPPQAKVV